MPQRLVLTKTEHDRTSRSWPTTSSLLEAQPAAVRFAAQRAARLTRTLSRNSGGLSESAIDIEEAVIIKGVEEGDIGPIDRSSPGLRLEQRIRILLPRAQVRCSWRLFKQYIEFYARLLRQESPRIARVCEPQETTTW
jgi:hypothetical protein